MIARLRLLYPFAHIDICLSSDVTVTLPPNSITELLVHCCEFVRMVAVMSALTPLPPLPLRFAHHGPYVCGERMCTSQSSALGRAA